MLSRLEVSGYSFEPWEYTVAAFRKVQQPVGVRVGKGAGGQEEETAGFLNEVRRVPDGFCWAGG